MSLSKPTRRQFSIGLASASAFLAMPAVIRAQENILRLYTWEGYAEPELVSKFESENNCSVKITYTGSVDEMFAKVQGSGGKDFDVVSFDTGSAGRYLEKKLVLPLDRALLPNLGNLIEVFSKQPSIETDGNLWAVPHAWGSLPLIYLKSAFPTAPDSWAAMWDPQYAQQVIALDDANHNTALAAIMLGYPDPYNLSDEQLAGAKAKLIELKRNLLTYFAGYDEGVSIFADNGAKLMFSMGEPQAKSLVSRGVDVGIAIPKEGAIGWIDCQSITVGARDPLLAHKWINACLEKSVGQIMSEKIGYGNVVDNGWNDKIGLTYADRLIYLAQPESYEKRAQLWNEVKAS
jgi:spermidine/putrescine-binding protein